MKYKILIAITAVVLLAIGSYLLITNRAKSTSDKTIYSNGIGDIRIGDDYDKVYSYCKKNNFKIIQKGGKEIQTDAGLYLYQDSSLMILIGNKNWGLPPFTVKMISIYSKDFRTEDNIHVGMTLKDLLKLFPDSKIELSNEDGSFYISPAKYQATNQSGVPNIVFGIKLSLNAEEIENKSEEEINKIRHNLNGSIESISIFDWN